MPEPTLLRCTSVEAPASAARLIDDDFTIVHYDHGFRYGAGIFDINTTCSAEQVIAGAQRVARCWGRTTLWWHGIGATSPPALQEALLAAEGAVAARHCVLEFDLSTQLPPAESDHGVTITRPTPADLCRALNLMVNTGDVESPERDDLALAHRHQHDADAAQHHLLALWNGEPAGTAAVSYDGTEPAHLWGARTVASARHHGVYRALLRARLELARQHGCAGAVTRTEPHLAPLLTRLGFIPSSEELLIRTTV
ncbi:GNAT family N-acetyltransferase [Calidifontibacter terrae]